MRVNPNLQSMYNFCLFLLERGIIAQKHKIGVISAKIYVTFW